MKCYYFIAGHINLNYYFCVYGTSFFVVNFWKSLSLRASMCKYFGDSDHVSMLSVCVLYIAKDDMMYAYWQGIFQFDKVISILSKICLNREIFHF